MTRDKSKEEKPQLFEPWDGEYIGNIWGWKFSIISAIIIALFFALFFWRMKVNQENGYVPDPVPETSLHFVPESEALVLRV